MRDASDWYSRLVKDLNAEGFPKDVMPPAEFCRVELGLYFLAAYFPDEPVGVLQSVLSGYVRAGQDVEAGGDRCVSGGISLLACAQKTRLAGTCWSSAGAPTPPALLARR